MHHQTNEVIATLAFWLTDTKTTSNSRLICDCLSVLVILEKPLQDVD